MRKRKIKGKIGNAGGPAPALCAYPETATNAERQAMQLYLADMAEKTRRNVAEQVARRQAMQLTSSGLSQSDVLSRSKSRDDKRCDSMSSKPQKLND